MTHIPDPIPAQFEAIRTMPNLAVGSPRPDLMAVIRAKGVFTCSLHCNATLTVMQGTMETAELPNLNQNEDLFWTDGQGNYFRLTHQDPIVIMVMYRRQMTGPMHADYLKRYVA